MTWNDLLKTELQKPYMKTLQEKLKSDYQNKTIFPPKEMVFKALDLTPLDEVKVVIIGQDPYHNDHEAMGLSFSVPRGVKIPPSLINIYKELHEDLGLVAPNHGDLTSWARNGVLLLNASLTVEKNKPASHKDYGWLIFTDEIIKAVNKKNNPVVFILWGNFARSKKKLITNPIHLILESAHPSPLSAYNGFFGSKPFSKTNDFLINHHIDPINWSIE